MVASITEIKKKKHAGLSLTKFITQKVISLTY